MAAPNGASYFALANTNGWQSSISFAGAADKAPMVPLFPSQCPGTVKGYTPETRVEPDAECQNRTVEFQNISVSVDYNMWSGEELRLADYNQGRRYRLAAPISGNAIFGTTGNMNGPFSHIGRPATSNLFSSAVKAKADTGFQNPFGPSVKKKEDEVGWLRSCYSGTTPIAVRCGSDTETYFFPREVLMQNFRHFRDRSDQQDPGKETIHHLKDVTTLTFARLVRWTQTSHDSYEDPANPDTVYTVKEILDQSIASHDLGLIKPSLHIIHISCLLATVLLRDRRKLTADHISLVMSHTAFSMNGQVFKVLVRSGMRPFLQGALMRKAPDWAPPRALPGHADGQEWVSILKHCRQLRAENKEYAVCVAQHGADVLENAKRSLDGHAVFYDSLDEDEMKGRRKLFFTVTFSI